MKKFLMTVVVSVAMASLGSAPVAQADENPPIEREVAVSVSDAYVPSGFDSGSDAYVVVNGLFPNGCYRWKGTQVTHDPVTFRHEIRSFATVRAGMCIAVLVPYTEEVRMGRLETGVHTLRFMNGDGTYLEKSMTIE